MTKKSSSRDAFFNLRALLRFRARQRRRLLSALIALSINSGSSAVAAGSQTKVAKPIVIYSVHNDVSPALRDVEPWPVQRVQEHEAAANWRVWHRFHKEAA